MRQQGTLQEIFEHYAPVLEEYFRLKKLATTEERTSGSTIDETIKKAYQRDARLDFIDEVWEDFRRIV